MTQVTVPIPRPNIPGLSFGAGALATTQVEAQVFGEFAVHRCIGYDGKPAFSFAVSHVPTGISIATGQHGYIYALAKKLHLRFPTVFAGLTFVPERVKLQAHRDYETLVAFVNKEKKA